MSSNAKAELEQFSNSRIRMFSQMLRLFDTGSLIDLGAGHAKFSLQARNLGWKATALDARVARLPELPPDIEFIHAPVESDAWDPADYSLILCLGLYYHLTQEAQFNLLDRISGKPLILETHFATTDGSGYFQGLSEMQERNGEQGKFFPEPKGDQRKDEDLRASWDNEESWWATHESLLATLGRYGYGEVWTINHPYAGAQRTFYACMPNA